MSSKCCQALNSSTSTSTHADAERRSTARAGAARPLRGRSGCCGRPCGSHIRRSRRDPRRPPCPHPTRSAARSLALRARGFRSISSSPGSIGLPVSTRDQPPHPRSSARSVCFTMRSSSEWKLITASRPPACSRAAARPRNSSSPSSSPLTQMRSAWKVRVAGSIRCQPRAAGGAPHDRRQLAGRLDRRAGCARRRSRGRSAATCAPRRTGRSRRPAPSRRRRRAARRPSAPAS